jgi:hypothetical protein
MYLFLEFQFGSDSVLPANVEFDNRISTSRIFEVTDTVEPFTGDMEVVASTQDDTAVIVMVVDSFVVEISPDRRQWSFAKADHMEVEEDCNQFSSSSKLLGKPNQLFEGGNVRKGLKGNRKELKGSSGSRSQQRKSSSSIADESWSPSSERSRMSSADPVRDRYREQREKNNEACRKSRQRRKARESELEEAAAKLEIENQRLKMKADQMERLLKKLGSDS